MSTGLDEARQARQLDAAHAPRFPQARHEARLSPSRPAHRPRDMESRDTHFATSSVARLVDRGDSRQCGMVRVVKGGVWKNVRVHHSP